MTHTLYLPEELEKLRRQHGENAPHDSPVAHAPGPAARATAVAAAPSPMSRVETPRAVPASDGEITALRRELEDLRSAVAQLRLGSGRRGQSIARECRRNRPAPSIAGGMTRLQASNEQDFP